MHTEIVVATRDHRAVLRTLFELYAHDFSPMTGADVDERGHYVGDTFLEGLWDVTDASLRTFLFLVDGKWAGFAFVEEGSYITADEDQHWLMDEFFVVRKYRGRGVGEWFARALFARFPGTWEVGEIAANTEAQQFWRKVIGRYAGTFDEIIVNNGRWQGPVQRFSTSGES